MGKLALKNRYKKPGQQNQAATKQDQIAQYQVDTDSGQELMNQFNDFMDVHAVWLIIRL